MTGFLNAHGTSPCLFGGEFLDFSIVPDEERRDRRAQDVPDTSQPAMPELFDQHFEEVFWESLFLGADFDWNIEPEESTSEWVQRRYADVIQLNERYGFARAATNDNQFESDDELHPLERSLPRLNKRSSQYRGENPRRGNNHRQSTGWKKYANECFRSA